MGKRKTTHRKLEPGIYAYPSPLGDEFKIKKMTVKGSVHWVVQANAGPWLGELTLNDEFHSLSEAKMFIDDFCSEGWGNRKGTMKT